MESSNIFQSYLQQLQALLKNQDLSKIELLAESILEAWKHGKRVYLCGNGGSAANAMHIANDLIYGVSKGNSRGIRACALTADSSILTCLANDVSYAEVFAKQLEVLGEQGDLLVTLSGSGNSPNILSALEMGRNLKMKTFAILGYTGGKALESCDVAIHSPIQDMQIAEDFQLIVGHMVMRWLAANSQADSKNDLNRRE